MRSYGYQFAVVEAATGDHVGDVAAVIDAADPRLATIGATLATSAQSNGYASEAVAWFLGYLLLEREKHRVTADCDVRASTSSRSSNASRCAVRHTIFGSLRSAWWTEA